MALINRAKRRTGLDPLAYMGTEPISPPEFDAINRAPTSNDYQGFNLGSIWLDTTTQDGWFLVSKDNNEANWVKFVGGQGDIIGLIGDVGDPSYPNNNGIIHVAGDNLNTLSTSNDNTLVIALRNEITIDIANLPNTTINGGAGIIRFGGSRFISNYGIENTFYGASSGNTTLNTDLAVANVGIGTSALISITSGSSNNALGYHSLPFLTSGKNNLALGYFAGSSYTGSESNNILLGNVGGTAGESNVLRIGSGTGTGSGQLNAAFIAGINGITPSQPDTLPVVIDSNGQLGTVSEVASWTPELAFGGSSTGITYDLRAGSYYKIGKVVYITCGMVLSSKGTATGNASITGLPFNPRNNIAIFSFGNAILTLPTGTTQFYGLINPGAAAIFLRAVGSNVNLDVTDVEFSNNAIFILTGFYFSD